MVQKKENAAMQYVRSTLSILCAPLLYGVLCVPLLGMLLAMYPDLLNEAGGTYDVALTIKSELLQGIMLVIIGFVVALVAPSRPMVHTSIAVLLMLAIGVSVQLSFWDSMLIWHHFVFFGLIVGGLYLGAWLKGIILPRHEAVD
jgi:hypothetical protein